jgi:hypothetical protein
MTSSILEQLEAQLATLPTGSTKHGMEPGYDVMAHWIKHLSDDRRAEVLSALPTWLQDETHSWHYQGAMELALLLNDGTLLDAAVREARRRGIHDLGDFEEYPPWLIFDLLLLSTISRWPGDPGTHSRAYLQDLRAGAQKASSYPRQLLGIRAWFTECLLEPTTNKMCLTQALNVLRQWRNARLLRSGLSLLHAYFASTPEGVSDLREVLTAEEFAVAFAS